MTIQFDARRTAIMLKQHLIERAHRMQEVILRVERFGADVIVYPMLGYVGSTEPLDELLANHAECLAQIRALRDAIDRASEADIRAFVAGIKADREGKPS